MFRISLMEGIKNIDKNRTMTYLTVLLFSFLFVLQGYTYSYYTVNKIRTERLEHETLQEYHLYELTTIRGTYPGIARHWFSEGLELETAEYFAELEAAEHITYVGLVRENMVIAGFSGDRKVFSNGRDWSTWNLLSCLRVTPNFYEVEDYRVIEGRDFTSEDMPYVEGKPRAVLLGYKFRDFYEVGDILDLDPEYYSQFVYMPIPQLEVIGFLAEDTTVLSRNGEKIYDLDNYIVYPEYIIPIEEWGNYSEKVIHDAVNIYYEYSWGAIKIMFTDEDLEEGLIEWRQALDNYGGMAPYWTFFEKGSSMQKVQSRTESLTSFYSEITGVLMFFATITVLISIVNRISRNVKDYAVHIAVGATRGSSVWFIISEMSIILICSTVIGMFATKWLINSVNMPFYFWQSLAIYAVTSIVILALSAIIARLAIRKYDMCTLIK